jgi:hypothetical protein
MEASSDAYCPGSLYRRTCVLVDHGQAGSYVLDIFRAGGGATRDYVFHGPGNVYETKTIPLAPTEPDSSFNSLPLEKIVTGSGQSPWSIRWELPGGYELRALSPGHPGEIVALGQGWGQRDHYNTDRGATLPYVVRRRVGEQRSDAFVTVFAGNAANQQLVEGVRMLPVGGTEPEGAVAVEVETADGPDMVVSMVEAHRVTVPFGGGDAITDGRFAAVVSRGGQPSRACLVEGTRLVAAGVSLTSPVAAFQGKVLGVGSAHTDSYFVVDASLPRDGQLDGQTFFTVDGGIRRAYPIVAIEEVEGQIRVLTKRAGRGFEARSAQRWELPVTLERGIPE